MESTKWACTSFCVKKKKQANIQNLMETHQQDSGATSRGPTGMIWDTERQKQDIE